MIQAASSVLVVGGGPAGAATALALAQARIPVVVLERATFPRDKVCGDVLLPEAQAALAELGLATTEVESMAVPCTGLRYVAQDGTEVADRFHDHRGIARPWWIVKRQRFDAWLIAQAERFGATVLTGHAASGLERTTDGRVCGVFGRRADGTSFRLPASVVVGADGALGVVARELGLVAPQPRDTCLAVRAYATGVRCPEPYLEVYTSPRLLPGTAWVLPVGPDEVNVGLGLLRSTRDALASTPQQLLRELMAAHPALARRLVGAQIGPLHGWALPGATERRALVRDGVLLVGDAGALVDPFTGHGIHHALRSGMIAASVIAEAAGDLSEAHLSLHEHRCRAAFRHETAIGARLQELHARPALVRVGLALAARLPRVRRTLVGLVGHAAPRRELLSWGRLLPGMAVEGR